MCQAYKQHTVVNVWSHFQIAGSQGRIILSSGIFVLAMDEIRYEGKYRPSLEDIIQGNKSPLDVREAEQAVVHKKTPNGAFSYCVFIGKSSSRRE